jgi:hypothetical protein
MNSEGLLELPIENGCFWVQDQRSLHRPTAGGNSNRAEGRAIYLEATKGEVHIQFIFESGTLRLYRVFYTSPRFMPK